MKYFFIFFFLAFSVNIQAQISDFESIDFQKADSIAAKYNSDDVKNLPILAFNLTNSLTTDVERFRAIYTWVSTNIAFEYSYYLRNERKRKSLRNDTLAQLDWNAKITSKVFDKLLKEQKTVCTGYAYLIQELASLANINCKIIDGYARTANCNIFELEMPNHSWNAVELNGKWYLCDATWSSGYMLTDNDRTSFIADYNDGYFLSEPELFVKNHYPLDTTWILMQKAPSIDEFLNAPIIYLHAFKNKIIPKTPHTLRLRLNKKDSVIFTFATKNKIPEDSIYLNLRSASYSELVKPHIITNQNGILELKYFLIYRGNYDLDFLLGKDNIVTYSLRVRKKKRQ